MGAWAEDVSTATQAGFTPEEISGMQSERSQGMLDAGFSSTEVEDYFGVKRPDLGPMQDMVRGAMDNLRVANEPKADGAPAPKKADGLWENIQAGFQNSTSGLIKRGKLPDLTPDDQNSFYRIASQVANVAGDIPAMAAGAVAVAPLLPQAIAVGGGISALAGPEAVPVGMAAGAAALEGFGAFGLPAAMRTALMDHYRKGDIVDFKDFWERTSATFVSGIKQGSIGALTMGAGAVAGPLAAPFAGAPGAFTAKTATEIGVMVGAGKAMEGQVPKMSDFSDAAVVVLGMHAVSSAIGGRPAVVPEAGLPVIEGKLRDIYAESGVKPEQVLADAQKDPVIYQDLLTNTEEIPKAYKPAEPMKRILGDEAGAIKVPPKQPDIVRSEAETKVLSRIGEQTKESKMPSLDEVYTAVFDKLNPIKNFRDALTEEDLKANQDPYTLARLHAGVFGKVQHVIDHATFDFKTLKDNGKSLSEVLEPVGKDTDGFRAYAISKRAMEKEAQGIKTGVDVEAAKQVVADGAGKFESTLRDLHDYQGRMIDYLVKSGILNQDSADAFKETNKDYVPFYRVLEEDMGSKSAGKGFSVRNPVKGMEGSERKIVDPLESVIKNTYLYTVLAERNRVMKSMVDLAEKNPDTAATLMTRVKTPMKAIDISPQEQARFQDEFGMDGTPSDFAMTVFRPISKQLAPNEIAVYRDGKREVYEVQPELAAALKGMDSQGANFLVKMMRPFSSALRAGTVLTPDFATRNVFSDQVLAFIQSKAGYIPFYDFVKGLGSVWKEDESFRTWLKSGGANSALVSMDRDYISKHIFELDAETKFTDKVWNVVDTPIEMMRVLSEAGENATRVGEFKKALAGSTKASDIMAAGYDAREVTVDFAKRGAKMQALNQITAFQGAHIAGLDRLARAFKDDPKGTTTRMGLITATSVLVWWLNHDDERVKQSPAYQRDLFWEIPTNSWQKPTTPQELASMPEYLKRQNAQGEWEVNKGTVYRFKKPYEPGIIFGSSVERMLDAFFTDNPDSFRAFEKNMVDVFTPPLMPTAAGPFLEHYFNKNTFTGHSIVPGYLEKVAPAYQYAPYTSESAKIIGKGVRMLPGMGSPGDFSSPLVIENYIRDWTGNAGNYALKLADEALVRSGAVPDPLKPASTLADNPFVKMFVVRYPSASAKSIQDFHDDYAQMSVTMNTMQYLKRTGDVNELQKFLTNNNEPLAKLSGIQEALGNLNRHTQIVTKNPDIKPEEKRQIIDGDYYTMIEVAKEGNKILRQIRADMPKSQ